MNLSGSSFQAAQANKRSAGVPSTHQTLNDEELVRGSFSFAANSFQDGRMSNLGDILCCMNRKCTSTKRLCKPSSIPYHSQRRTISRLATSPIPLTATSAKASSGVWLAKVSSAENVESSVTKSVKIYSTPTVFKVGLISDSTCSTTCSIPFANFFYYFSKDVLKKAPNMEPRTRRKALWKQ